MHEDNYHGDKLPRIKSNMIKSGEFFPRDLGPAVRGSFGAPRLRAPNLLPAQDRARVSFAPPCSTLCELSGDATSSKDI